MATGGNLFGMGEVPLPPGRSRSLTVRNLVLHDAINTDGLGIATTLGFSAIFIGHVGLVECVARGFHALAST